MSVQQIPYDEAREGLKQHLIEKYGEKEGTQKYNDIISNEGQATNTYGFETQDSTKQDLEEVAQECRQKVEEIESIGGEDDDGNTTFY